MTNTRPRALVPQAATVEANAPCRLLPSGAVVRFPAAVQVQATKKLGVESYYFQHEGQQYSVPSHFVTLQNPEVMLEYKLRGDDHWIPKQCTSARDAARQAAILKRNGAEVRLRGGLTL
jgi:hypothetical protein